MKYQEAKRALVGTIVYWEGNQDDPGTIGKKSDTAFYVDWANGQRGWIDYRDAKKVTLFIRNPKQEAQNAPSTPL